MNIKLFIATGIALAFAGAVQAESTEGCGAAYIAAFEGASKMSNSDSCTWEAVDTLEEAVAVQKTAVAHFTEQGAEPIGYKVTSASDGRVIGTIMSSMVLSSGDSVEIASGAALVSEADILVRVKDEGINQATTLEEVVQHLDQVIPLIESSDMMTAEGIGRTVASWTATNGNARYAFAGEPFEIDGSPEWVERIGAINVVFSDETGKVMNDTAMSRNPLESVLDVLASFEARGQGEQLKTGDLISLGNFGRPMRPKAGQTFTAVFQGLEDSEVSANYK